MILEKYVHMGNPINNFRRVFRSSFSASLRLAGSSKSQGFPCESVTNLSSDQPPESPFFCNTAQLEVGYILHPHNSVLAKMVRTRGRRSSHFREINVHVGIGFMCSRWRCRRLERRLKMQTWSFWAPRLFIGWRFDRLSLRCRLQPSAPVSGGGEVLFHSTAACRRVHLVQR